VARGKQKQANKAIVPRRIAKKEMDKERANSALMLSRGRDKKVVAAEKLASRREALLARGSPPCKKRLPKQRRLSSNQHRGMKVSRVPLINRVRMVPVSRNKIAHSSRARVVAERILVHRRALRIKVVTISANRRALVAM
jgi:hypothetical protein